MLVCSDCPDEQKWKVVHDVLLTMRSHGFFDETFMDLKFGFVTAYLQKCVEMVESLSLGSAEGKDLDALKKELEGHYELYDDLFNSFENSSASFLVFIGHIRGMRRDSQKHLLEDLDSFVHVKDRVIQVCLTLQHITGVLRELIYECQGKGIWKLIVIFWNF